VRTIERIEFLHIYFNSLNMKNIGSVILYIALELVEDWAAQQMLREIYLQNQKFLGHLKLFENNYPGLRKILSCLHKLNRFSSYAFKHFSDKEAFDLNTKPSFLHYLRHRQSDNLFHHKALQTNTL